MGQENQPAKTNPRERSLPHPIMVATISDDQNPKHRGHPNSSAKNSFLLISQLFQSSQDSTRGLAALDIKGLNKCRGSEVKNQVHINQVLIRTPRIYKIIVSTDYSNPLIGGPPFI